MKRYIPLYEKYNISDFINLIKSFTNYIDFEQYVSNALYKINKIAKTSGPDIRKDYYNIKNKIIIKFGKDTHIIHQFPLGGYGRLYKIGNETFHQIIDPYEIEKPILKEIINKYIRTTKYNIDSIDIFINSESGELDISVKLDSNYGEERYDLMDKIYLDIKRSFKQELNSKFKTVNPPKINKKDPLTQEEINVLNYLIELPEKDLKKIYNKYHNK